MTFKWPDTILYDGREVQCARKTPNFAEFILSSGYMNRRIYLSRDQWLRHLKK